LFADVDAPRITGDPLTPISGVTLDSRRVQPGFLFGALRGASSDGLAFVPDALARGASAVLSDRPRPSDIVCPWVLAEDARREFALAARAFHNHPDLAIPVIGITGTNGKTTTAFLLESIVEAAGGSAGLLGTVSYRVAGRDLPAERTTPEADVLL